MGLVRLGQSFYALVWVEEIGPTDNSVTPWNRLQYHVRTLSISNWISNRISIQKINIVQPGTLKQPYSFLYQLQTVFKSLESTAWHNPLSIADVGLVLQIVISIPSARKIVSLYCQTIPLAILCQIISVYFTTFRQNVILKVQIKSNQTLFAVTEYAHH